MTTTQETAIDPAKIEQFAGKMMGALNGAGLVFLASIGRHTGLFDTLADLPPSTSEEIARATGLEERYVREWLGGMTVAGVTAYEPSTKQYSLPPEHAAFLTTAAGPNNLTAIAQLFPMMGTIAGEVEASFRNGGGVPYSSYEDFQAIQDETTRPFIDAALVGAVLPLVDGLLERLTAGGLEVADIGCGAGHAVNVMAAAFPASRFTGFDFSADGIEIGRAEAAAQGLTNAGFAVCDLAEPGETGQYDLVTAIEVVHDLAKPAAVLKGVFDALKPGGVFLAVDMAASSNLEENLDHPAGTMLFTASLLHCMTVSLSQGGAGMGAMMGEQKMVALLHDAGFADVAVKHLEGDFIYNYYVARK